MDEVRRAAADAAEGVEGAAAAAAAGDTAALPCPRRLIKKNLENFQRWGKKEKGGGEIYPGTAQPRQPQTPEIEQQLDEWVTAKRNKGWRTACVHCSSRCCAPSSSGGRAGRWEGGRDCGMRWSVDWGAR